MSWFIYLEESLFSGVRDEKGQNEPEMKLFRFLLILRIFLIFCIKLQQ